LTGPVRHGGETEKEITMDARLNFLGNPVSAKFIKHVNAASAAVMNSGLPAATAALVEIRRRRRLRRGLGERRQAPRR
jgi:hypothetical protein